MDKLTREIINHLEGAFSNVTEALDKVGDLDLSYEVGYSLEDIQFDIQTVIEQLQK